MMGYLTAGLGLTLIIVSGAFKIYHDNTQETILYINAQLETSKANQAKLEDVIEEQNQSLETQAKNHEAVVIALEKMSDENKAAQQELNRLQDTFSRHSLSQLSEAKPGLIERIINNASKKVGENFTDLTSSI
tara:strand:- start:1711 stop:2109 length:399 start_codon:yes stop_codon:yes gene_type:complete